MVAPKATRSTTHCNTVPVCYVLLVLHMLQGIVMQVLTFAIEEPPQQQDVYVLTLITSQVAALHHVSTSQPAAQEFPHLSSCQH